MTARSLDSITPSIRSTSQRGLTYILFIAGACLLHTATSHAGPLSRAYEQYKSAHPSLKPHDYIIKAAQQDVITQKKNYYPTVTTELKQLAIGQDIEEKGTGIFQNGSDHYDGSRAKIELDQPLLDATLKHKVGEAEAITRYHQGMMRAKEDDLTQIFVIHYINAIRFEHLARSCNRIINRLESETVNIDEKFKERMVTVEDINNIKSALVSMKQEKLLFQQQQRQCLTEIGLSPAAIAGISIHHDKPFRLPVPVGSNHHHSAQAETLRAEIDAYESRIKASLGKDMPRLSLYGLAEYDDAGGSVFGVERRLNGYEAGVMLRWNWFDSGINRSEAQKLEYLKKAKEAELDAQIAQAGKASGLRRQSLQLSEANLNSLNQMVKHQESIARAAELSYKEGGEMTYVNMINALLMYESQVRQQAHAKFDHISRQTELYANHVGWSNNLINDLDKVFSSTN